MLSLSNRKEMLQAGDPVQFQVAAANNNNSNLAVNVKSLKEKQRAFVEAMKGNAQKTSLDSRFLDLLTTTCGESSL